MPISADGNGTSLDRVAEHVQLVELRAGVVPEGHDSILQVSGQVGEFTPLCVVGPLEGELLLGAMQIWFDVAPKGDQRNQEACDRLDHGDLDLPIDAIRDGRDDVVAILLAAQVEVNELLIIEHGKKAVNHCDSGVCSGGTGGECSAGAERSVLARLTQNVKRITLASE